MRINFRINLRRKRGVKWMMISGFMMILMDMVALRNDNGFPDKVLWRKGFLNLSHKELLISYDF